MSGNIRHGMAPSRLPDQKHHGERVTVVVACAFPVSFQKGAHSPFVELLESGASLGKPLAHVGHQVDLLPTTAAAIALLRACLTNRRSRRKETLIYTKTTENSLLSAFRFQRPHAGPDLPAIPLSSRLRCSCFRPGRRLIWRIAWLKTMTATAEYAARRSRKRAGPRDVPARSTSECKSARGFRSDVLTRV
jgi:hypothetical protein